MSRTLTDLVSDYGDSPSAHLTVTSQLLNLCARQSKMLNVHVMQPHDFELVVSGVLPLNPRTRHRPEDEAATPVQEWDIPPWIDGNEDEQGQADESAKERNYLISEADGLYYKAKQYASIVSFNMKMFANRSIQHCGAVIPFLFIICVCIVIFWLSRLL